MCALDVKAEWKKDLLLLLEHNLHPPKCDDAAIANIFRLCHQHQTKTSISTERLLALIDGSLDRMQDRLNIGNWKLVSLEDRQTITLLTYYKILLSIEIVSEDNVDIIASKYFNIIDHGLLFGAPLNPPYSELLQKCAAVIKKNESRWKPTNKKENIRFSHFLHRKPVPDYYKYGSPINIKVCPSLDNFYKNHMAVRKPVVLQECIGDWPAIELWDSMDYIIKTAGHRTVPIEIGSKYTDSNWTQKLITVADYIENYILNEQANIGYLAQHQMFDQIPEFLQDFSVPDYCCLHEDPDSENDVYVDKNAWFGPAGTISPLHTDPKHNLLAQVIGEKLVILFSPEDSEFLYPHPEDLLQNTAQIDPINPDYVKFPNFKNASPYYHILKSGEMMYIPPKWWHYVSSLSISFSISFWWN